MADYIYLLETRLSPAQQRAIGTVRSVARDNDLTVFLTGGAVRDLTGGGSIRDLDLSIQGDALRLKQPLEAAGATVIGAYPEAGRLFLTAPGSVRVEVSSAMRVTYPEPGRPVYEPSNISEDLRSRDFTANAMAISLNEGSYGLLMDPLNGVADIENRELRLVNNYGFIEEPSRLIRAARLVSRLGWQMEERTRQRYDTGKEENYIAAMNPWNRGYETEEIFHEEDALRTLRALEAEGLSVHLFPPLQSAKANSTALAELADRQGQLQVQGILAQSAALAFSLLTGKLTPNEIGQLKGMFVRPGFVREIELLDGHVREFAARMGGKETAAASAAWKTLHETEPNLVLAVFANSKAANVQARLKTFLTESPGARQRIPYALMQEMRITPDVPGYQELLDTLFFELMDGKLAATDEMKAFLEPYSPPAPPPPVNLRRARAKKEARPSRAKGKKGTEPEALPLTVAEEEEAVGVEAGLMEVGDLTGPDRGPYPTPDIPLIGKVAPEVEIFPAIDEPLPEPAELAPLPEMETPLVPKAKQPVPKKVVAKSKSAVPPPEKVAPLAKATSPVDAKPAKDTSKTKEKKAPETTPVAMKKTLAKAPAKAAAPVKRTAKKAAVAPQKAALALAEAAPAKATAKKQAPAKKTVAAKKTVSAAQAAPAAKKGTTAAKKGPVPVNSAPPTKKSPVAAKKATVPAKTSSGTKKSAAKSVSKKAAPRER